VSDDEKRLSDGREELGKEFADTEYADRQHVARAFEDPNSLDDRRIGKSFEKTNSSAKKKRTHPDEIARKPQSRKVLYWFLFGMVLLFVGILIFGWIPRHLRNKETEQRADAAKNSEPEVEVVKVVHAQSNSGLVIPGTTTPLEEAYVYGRANGYLKRRLVDIGDHVREGQLLAIIDAPDLDRSVDQARQKLQQAQAQKAQQDTQLALAKVTNERYKALVARGVFSRQDGDQRDADFQSQIANVAAAERNVQAYKANLARQIALQGYERVTSPFTGVVTQRNVDVGALIQTSGSGGGSAPAPMSQAGTGTQAGATNTSGSSGNANTLATPSTGGTQGGPLFAIAAMNRLRILVSVPEGYAGEVKAGQRATLFFQEYPQRKFYGDVTRTASEIDQNTRTLLTEVQVDNRDGKLMAGMYAVVTFGAAAGPGPLVVSGDSVAIRKDRPTVAVVKDGTVHLVPVDIGRDFGSTVEIVNGLQEGDLVASTFTDDVRDGARVKIVEDKSQQQKLNPPPPPKQATTPGGSTQYGDPGITDQDMQANSASRNRKKAAGAIRRARAIKAANHEREDPSGNGNLAGRRAGVTCAAECNTGSARRSGHLRICSS
jgi:multidrug efflux pump subunit AcrA (membrane-fusion protein)